MSQETPINVATVNSNTEMSPNIGEIAAALSKAQSELDSAKKDNSGYGYTYSDLATVISTAKPVLSKYNLAITQLVGNTGNTVEVTTILAHSSGQYFKSIATLPLVDMKGCTPAQNAGASLSYLRRYAYQAILGMASEDNDASGQPSPKSSYTSVKPAAEKKSKTSPKTDFRVKGGSDDDL